MAAVSLFPKIVSKSAYSIVPRISLTHVRADEVGRHQITTISQLVEEYSEVHLFPVLVHIHPLFSKVAYDSAIFANYEKHYRGMKVVQAIRNEDIELLKSLINSGDINPCSKGEGAIEVAKLDHPEVTSIFFTGLVKLGEDASLWEHCLNDPATWNLMRLNLLDQDSRGKSFYAVMYNRGTEVIRAFRKRDTQSVERLLATGNINEHAKLKLLQEALKIHDDEDHEIISVLLKGLQTNVSNLQEHSFYQSIAQPDGWMRFKAGHSHKLFI